jgi:hypothetical protein
VTAIRRSPPTVHAPTHLHDLRAGFPGKATHQPDPSGMWLIHKLNRKNSTDVLLCRLRLYGPLLTVLVGLSNRTAATHPLLGVSRALCRKCWDGRRAPVDCGSLGKPDRERQSSCTGRARRGANPELTATPPQPAQSRAVVRGGHLESNDRTCRDKGRSRVSCKA